MKIDCIYRYLFTLATTLQQQSSNTLSTLKRNFIPLPGFYGLGSSKPTNNKSTLRILQFNILADGLSALRHDLGMFSRAGKSILDWDARKSKILYEITQYNPDVITM